MSYTYTARNRVLTEAQLKIPVLKFALQRLSNISLHRGTYLTKLKFHSSGRRSRSELYDSLEALAMPLLTRLDLATGVLGWRDSTGDIRLCSQTQLAADSGLSTSALGRVIERLAAEGYVERRFERVATRRGELLWSVKTRTMIKLTDQFFRALGLSREYGQARKWAAKRAARSTGLALHTQAIRNKTWNRQAQASRKLGFLRWVNRHHERVEAEFAQSKIRVQLRVMQMQGVGKLPRDEFDSVVEAIMMQENPRYAQLKRANS